MVLLFMLFVFVCSGVVLLFFGNIVVCFYECDGVGDVYFDS